MTRILITGAAGFLGRRLTRALVEQGTLEGTPVTELILADRSAPDLPPTGTIAVSTYCGDLSDPTYVEGLCHAGFDGMFHLAALLTLEAEADPARAFAVNVAPLLRLIEGAKGCPKVVFPSSIAIHGGDLPDEVDDDHNPVPATTYGTHKAINELLISDYARLGRIDGRSLRLPIVVTRPGAPTPAVSDLVAALIREPMGGRDVVCSFAPDTPLPLVSAGAVANALMRLYETPRADLPTKSALNLPALTVTVAEIARALADRGAIGEIRYEPDPKLQAIVDGWPRRFISPRAEELGLIPDANINGVIADHIADMEDSA